jgi:hypothetical protein
MSKNFSNSATLAGSAGTCWRSVPVGVDQHPGVDEVVEIPLAAHPREAARHRATRIDPLAAGVPARAVSGEPEGSGSRMVRRWIRYELPVMVCVDVDEATEHAQITKVVPGDIGLARDHTGHLLVYNERMERVNDDLDSASAVAIHTAEDRDAWPAEAD